MAFTVLDYFRCQVIDSFAQLLTGADIGDMAFLNEVPLDSPCGSVCRRFIDKLRDLLLESDSLPTIRRHFIQGAMLNLSVLING